MCTPKGRTGYVPSNYLTPTPSSLGKPPSGVRPLPVPPGQKGDLPPLPVRRKSGRYAPEDEVEDAEWYLGDVSRDDVRVYAKVLQDTGVTGAFIMRVPESHPDAYALAVKTEGGKLKNLLIKCADGNFTLGPITAESVIELLRALSEGDGDLPVHIVPVRWRGGGGKIRQGATACGDMAGDVCSLLIALLTPPPLSLNKQPEDNVFNVARAKAFIHKLQKKKAAFAAQHPASTTDNARGSDDEVWLSVWLQLVSHIRPRLWRPVRQEESYLHVPLFVIFFKSRRMTAPVQIMPDKVEVERCRMYLARSPRLR